MAWGRIPPRLWHRSAWIDHNGEVPVIQVDHLPDDGESLAGVAVVLQDRIGPPGHQADHRLAPS
jgi:hypothetical protein